MLVSQSPGSMIGEDPASPRLCNGDRPRFSSTLQNLSPKYLTTRASSKLPRTKNRKMSQNRSFAYFPPTPNYPGDNNNSSNTNDSHNNNDSLLNNNNRSFNRHNNGHFYENPVFVFVNNNSNETDVRSAVEIARRIPEPLPQP